MADYELCQNCGTVGSDCPACDGTGKVYSSSYVEAQRARVTELEAEVEQERVRLAGCGAGAKGYARDCKPGDYGWSASLGEVQELLERCEASEHNFGIEHARVTELEAELRQSREEWQRWKATASSEEANETILMLEGDKERLRAALAEARAAWSELRMLDLEGPERVAAERRVGRALAPDDGSGT
jgi:multidrug resistance efflux pump